MSDKVKRFLSHPLLSNRRLLMVYGLSYRWLVC